MKITEEQYYKVGSEDITIKERNQILDSLENRKEEIVFLLYPNMKGEDFSFSGEYGNNEFIHIVGPGDKFKEPYRFSWHNCGYFPARWLWTDNKDILKEYNKNLNLYKKQEQERKENFKKEKERIRKIQKSIKSKLTKEELKYIKFK